MSYQVACECRRVLAVGAADAGSSLRCECGRTVDVPPLHLLRAAAGEQPVSPSVQIQAMLMKGELPLTRTCALCHRETSHAVRVSVECERVIVSNPRASAGAAMAGCLALGFFGLLAGYVARNASPPVQHGTHVAFILPVCVCEVCDRDLAAPNTLRRALTETPVYAALLEQYPEALIRRIH